MCKAMEINCPCCNDMVQIWNSEKNNIEYNGMCTTCGEEVNITVVEKD